MYEALDQLLAQILKDQSATMAQIVAKDERHADFPASTLKWARDPAALPRDSRLCGQRRLVIPAHFPADGRLDTVRWPIVPLPLRPPPLKRHGNAAPVTTVSDDLDRLRTATVGHNKSSTSLSRIACDASEQSMKHGSTLV